MRKGCTVAGFEWEWGADTPLGKPPGCHRWEACPDHLAGSGEPRGWGGVGVTSSLPFHRPGIWRSHSHPLAYNGKAVIMCGFLFLKHTVDSS